MDERRDEGVLWRRRPMVGTLIAWTGKPQLQAPIARIGISGELAKGRL